MNIYEGLENYFRKKKLESKELKKIPKDFELDLNTLDYQKWKDTEPQEYPSIMVWACIGYIKFMFGLFLMYAISEFRDYVFIKELLLGLWNLGIFFDIFIMLILIGFAVDITQILININSTKKHKLYWHNRLKKYK